MTASVVIARAATAAECAAVRPLVRAHIEYERRDIAIPQDWEHRTARHIRSGRLCMFVATVLGTPVGYASVTNDVETWAGEQFAHLDCLFVADTHRDSGIGRRLIAAVVEEARRNGNDVLQWQTPAWNAGAIRFYERLGATHHTKERFSLPLRSDVDAVAAQFV